MTGSMLDVVRSNVERRFGRSTWAALVGGVDHGSRVGGGDVEGSLGDAGSANGSRPAGRRESGRQGENAPSDALACWLGRQAIAGAARERPELFDRSPELRSFLASLDGCTVGPAADGEEVIPLAVEVHRSVDDDLFVTVDGEAACCALVEGLIAGAAEHYGERVRLELLKCCKWGDNRCVIRVAFDVVGSDVDFGFAPLSAAEPAERRARVV